MRDNVIKNIKYVRTMCILYQVKSVLFLLDPIPTSILEGLIQVKGVFSFNCFRLKIQTNFLDLKKLKKIKMIS